MKRRSFVHRSIVGTGALLAGPSLWAHRSLKDPMSRIGLTTVVFRKQFGSTNPDVGSDELTLFDIPGYFSERFGIRNLEFWSAHFESRDPSYLKDLKKALIQEQCTLVNIQADTPGKDMSDPEGGNSQIAIKEIKEWIDVGAYLGAPMVRGSFMKHSLDHGIDSTKELMKYIVRIA